MLLEQLLQGLDVAVQPFAVCRVSAGQRLDLGRADTAAIHYMLAGEGRFVIDDGRAIALAPGSAVIVPPARRQTLAQISAQLGAHIIKVKAPTEHLEQKEARKVYEKEKIPIGTLSDRVRHVVQSAFNGRRIVIFSGGAAKGTEELLQEIQGIRDGGAFGSIIGRNSFQRAKADGLSLLSSVMDIYAK